MSVDLRKGPRSLGCARCGDCCENIWLDASSAANIRRYQALSEAEKAELGDTPNQDFIADYWTPIETDRDNGAVRYRCAMYDPDRKLCMAHDSRPPVCRDFPWYGRAPGDLSGIEISPRCSYWLDVAPVLRPEDARPLLPLVLKRKGTNGGRDE